MVFPMLKVEVLQLVQRVVTLGTRILTLLINFSVLEYTRDIPGIYQCFKIYKGHL